MTETKRGRRIDWQYVVGLMLVPLVVAVLLAAGAWLQAARRYDPGYFTPEYVERYEAPGSVAIELEAVLRTGDRDHLQVLQATRGIPQAFSERPALILALLYNVEGDYFNYLYFDASNYERVIQHVREVDGRYVVVEEGLYFFFDSGRWLEFYAPIAATWWILVIVFTAGVWFFRYMRDVRLATFQR